MISVEVRSGSKVLKTVVEQTRYAHWAIHGFCDAAQPSIRDGVTIIIRREP